MDKHGSTFSEDAHIVGDLKFDQDLVFGGSIDGNITSQSGELRVGEKARIKGDIRTRSVIVSGKVEGNISAVERCELLETSIVEGDIVSPALQMEAGASLAGTSKIGKSS